MGSGQCMALRATALLALPRAHAAAAPLASPVVGSSRVSCLGLCAPWARVALAFTFVKSRVCRQFTNVNVTFPIVMLHVMLHVDVTFLIYQFCNMAEPLRSCNTAVILRRISA